MSPKLRKVLTNPIVGQRPNAPLETWNRIKKVTCDLRRAEVGAEAEKSPNLVENGPNGEIIVWCAFSQMCQVWDWCADGSGAEKSGLLESCRENLEYHGNSLNLVSSFSTGADTVLAMTIFPAPLGDILILLQENSQHRYLRAFYGSQSQTVPLSSPLDKGSLQMKVSSEYLVVSSSHGYLQLLTSMEVDENGKAPSFILRNVTGESMHALEDCLRPVIAHDGLEEARIKGTFVKTQVSGETPIYDIVGSWLVYSPTQVESNYFKKLQQSKQNLPKRAKSACTPMKLPSSGPLLSRVLTALSSSAAETFLSLSDLSSRAVKKSKDLIEKDISLKSVSSSIGSTLYTTASAFVSNSSKFVHKESHLIKILDLSSGNTIALFKPPGGVSHLSLNEYDLQLAQANSRGDSIYLWDLYKLPKEVSLVGSFSRGKTSAQIREMVWFMGNDCVDGTVASNAGLGCITERSGSIHWFHINYLFSGKERENFPNVQRNSDFSRKKSNSFLDVWTLPSLGAVKFMKLPTYANLADDVKRSDFKNPHTKDEFSWLNQLAFLDENLNVRLISSMNGKHNFKYKLSKGILDASGKHIPSTAQEAQQLCSGPLEYRSEQHRVEQEEIPISQAEIETCDRYASFIQNENCNIAVYDIGEKPGDNSGFWDRFAVFGSDISHITRDFRAPAPQRFSSCDTLA